MDSFIPFHKIIQDPNVSLKVITDLNGSTNNGQAYLFMLLYHFMILTYYYFVYE